VYLYLEVRGDGGACGSLSFSETIAERLSCPVSCVQGVVAEEAPFVYAFAASLAIGSIVLLFAPLFRYLRDSAAGRSLVGVAVIGLLGMSFAAIFAIFFTSSDSALFLPIAAVTVVLRITSPTLFYRGIRERLEDRDTWSMVRVLLAVAFLGFTALLLYGLYNLLAGNVPPWQVTLSEQLAMAVGAAFLILRTTYRFRPRFAMELWPFWVSGTAFAVAFIVIAPYAFSGFAIAYWISGIVGWIAGFIVLRFVE